MTVEETTRIDAVLSRRSFRKSASVAAALAGASPEVLMAETKNGMPHRALGVERKRRAFRHTTRPNTDEPLVNKG
jgi:hypothetical protein